MSTHHAYEAALADRCRRLANNLRRYADGTLPPDVLAALIGECRVIARLLDGLHDAPQPAAAPQTPGE